MKPNFSEMTRKELRSYLLEHRNDDDAFYAYMDKVYAAPATEYHPAPKSIEDLNDFPELLQKFRQERDQTSLG